MMRVLSVMLGKVVATFSRHFNIGAGETWPGEIGLILDKNIIKKLISGVKKGVILVAGTNGKTTTSKMIKTILKEGCKTAMVISNRSGANLLNGIASALISSANIFGRIKADWAVFEVDEATLPLALKEFVPKIVVCLNLFRDQLDRYGEIDLIAERWHRALLSLPKTTTLVLNADDPQIAYLGKGLKAKFLYFGLKDPSLFLTKAPHAADSIYCLSCGKKLEFEGIYLSHLGIWKCKKCGEERPNVALYAWDWPLPGVYNRYNTLASVLVGKRLGVGEKAIKNALKNFKPAFGRGEEFEVRGKRVKILLSKNPTGFNESIRTVVAAEERLVLMLALNDHIPDGRDVSWIWDVDFEKLTPCVREIICSGDRAYDLGLRLKYAFKTHPSFAKATEGAPRSLGEVGQNYNLKLKIIQELEQAIFSGLEAIRKAETLYILPTYSAMLEVRKIIGGRKIL